MTEREALVDWAECLTLGMDDARPSQWWFAATFHPCVGDHPDLELAAIRPIQAVTAFDRYQARTADLRFRCL
jgi:hypothetical protein